MVLRDNRESERKQDVEKYSLFVGNVVGSRTIPRAGERRGVFK